MAEESTAEKDEMIVLTGGGGNNRKIRDETIDMLPRAVKSQDDGAVILPPKEGGREIDLAGSASVTSSVPAPKNATFGLKGIRIGKTAPKDDDTLFAASLKPVHRPKDDVLTGDTVVLDRGVRRPRDGTLDEPGLHMRGAAPAPKDAPLDQTGRGFGRGGPHPKEVDPSRGRLDVIDAAERPKKRPEDDRGDDGITWIR